MAEDVRPMWSEEELDRALATLNADVPPGERALAKARADLANATGEPLPAARSAIGGPSPAALRATGDRSRAAQAAMGDRAPAGGAAMGKPRRRGRWAAAIGTVAAVGAAAVLVPALPIWEEPGVPGAAAAVLNTAADRIGATDEPVGPGQFRYVETHAWHGEFSDQADPYLRERVTRLWAPADQRQEWLERSLNTGKRKHLDGTEIAQGAEEQRSERTAACGDFDLEPAQRCQGLTFRLRPTPEQLADLPDDPREFHDWMREETEGAGRGPDQQMVVFAGDLLRGGLIPAEVRANFYRALAMVPTIEISDEHANLDGRLGVGLGVETDGQLYEIIVDPGTGQFIGERQSTTKNDEVSSYTSVTTGVVDRLGAEPAK